jgi:hypothetical protein
MGTTGRAMTAWKGLALVVAGSITLTACEKPAPPAPPPPPPRPSAPATPDPVDTQALLQQMGADARVQFPAERAPTSEELARAVISLSDAIARGDSGRLRSMLDASGQAVLDELESTGAWQQSTSRIEAVRVTNLDSADESMPTGDFSIAIQEPGVAYQLRWFATPNGASYTMTPMETDGRILARAGDFDGSSGSVDTSSTLEDEEGEPFDPGAGGSIEAGG